MSDTKTMTACCYTGGGGLALLERPVPTLGDGGALLRVEACSVCGTDIRTYRFGSAKIDEGRIVGHEAVGRIVEVAPEFAAQFPVGAAVGMAPAVGCGECPSCRRGRTNMCDTLQTIGFQHDGGFAGWMRIPRQAFVMGNVYRLPACGDLVPFALSEPLACVINAQSFLQIGPGETVAIFGAGAIGCLHAELALASGAAQVLIVEPSEDRIRQSRAILPQVQFLCSAREDPVNRLLEIHKGGVDVVIVACSVGAAQEQGMRMLAKGGRISLFGGLSGESTGFLDSNLIHYRELGVFGVHASTPANNREAMALIRDGKIEPEKYITRYPLTSMGEALREMAEGTILKAVMVSEENPAAK